MMKYCQWELLFGDYNKVCESLFDELSPSEARFRERFLRTVVQDLQELGLEIDTAHLKEALSDLPREDY